MEWRSFESDLIFTVLAQSNSAPMDKKAMADSIYAFAAAIFPSNISNAISTHT